MVPTGKDVTDGKRNSIVMAIRDENIDNVDDDDDEDDDDDDDEIYLGVETDDELDDSDEEGDANQGEVRKLRTISIGELQSFSVFDHDDIDIDGKRTEESAAGNTPKQSAPSSMDNRSNAREVDDVNVAAADDTKDDSKHEQDIKTSSTKGSGSRDQAESDAQSSVTDGTTDDGVVWI